MTPLSMSPVGDISFANERHLPPSQAVVHRHKYFSESFGENVEDLGESDEYFLFY
jgi:hypothetical protein